MIDCVALRLYIPRSLGQGRSHAHLCVRISRLFAHTKLINISSEHRDTQAIACSKI